MMIERETSTCTATMIYLPQDELAQAGLSDEDIFKGADQEGQDVWASLGRML
ncbi:hypothetical protein ACJX0J_027865, partial [Zea mays]